MIAAFAGMGALAHPRTEGKKQGGEETRLLSCTRIPGGAEAKGRACQNYSLSTETIASFSADAVEACGMQEHVTACGHGQHTKFRRHIAPKGSNVSLPRLLPDPVDLVQPMDPPGLFAGSGT